jgi:hypothetical protein
LIFFSKDFNVSFHKGLSYVDWKTGPLGCSDTSHTDSDLKTDEHFLRYMHCWMEKHLYTISDERINLSMLHFGYEYVAEKNNKVILDTVVQSIPSPIGYCSDDNLLKTYLKNEVDSNNEDIYVSRSNTIIFKCSINIEVQNSVYTLSNVYIVTKCEPSTKNTIDEENEPE